MARDKPVRILVSRDFKKMLQRLAVEQDISVTELTRRIKNIEVEKEKPFSWF